jgi:hypothetical protein
MYSVIDKKAHTREACHWSHAWPGFNPNTIVNPNSILELENSVPKREQLTVA